VRFDLKTVLLEGPDASGKTTAFSQIHKLTGFKWNIHDRSTLSMLCYAIMYNRDVDHWRQLVREEFHDLNNAIVVFLPPIEAIQERILSRGDEFQDTSTIVNLYKIFIQEVTPFVNYPNVMVIRKEIPDYNIIAKWLLSLESQTYEKLAQMCHKIVDQTPTKEINFLKLSWTDTDFSTILKSSLYYRDEVEYYEATRIKILDKLRDEVLGKNEYGMPQSLKSRRFVMTQDSCISFMHFVHREGVLHVNITCRSSEVSRIFHHDIHFLAEMGRFTRKTLEIPDQTPVRFYVTLDSAHVILQ